MTALDAINEQKARIEAVNTALYAAVDGSSVKPIRDRVDTWHAQALLWENLAGIVLDHPERAGEWGRIGNHLADDARDIAELAEDEETPAVVAHFLAGMPGALLAVSKNAVSGAARAVGFVANEAGRAANDVLWAALGAVPWPIYAVAGVVGVVALVIAVRSGGDVLKAAAKVA